jgi:hypothetical protein
MPWRKRFAQASIKSTQVGAGPYFDDFEKFVEEWGQEMTHLQAHRDAARTDRAFAPVAASATW